MSLKIILLKSLPHFSWINELNSQNIPEVLHDTHFSELKKLMLIKQQNHKNLGP